MSAADTGGIGGGNIIAAYGSWLWGRSHGKSPGFSNSKMLSRLVRGWVQQQVTSRPPDANVATPGAGGGGPSTIYIPPSDAEWERRRQESGHYGRTGAPKGPPPPKAPPNPNTMPPPRGMPPAFGTIWQQLVAYALIWALPYIVKKANESWSEYFARWQAREAAHRAAMSRRKPGGPGRKPTINPAPPPRAPDRPGVPTSAPPVAAAPTIIINMPQPPAAPRAPAPTPKPKTPKPGAGLSVPKIYRKPLPVPTVPVSVPAWKRYATLAAPFAPSILGLLKPAAAQKVRVFVDPLTVPQETVGNYFQLETAPSGAFGGSKPTGSKTCSCAPKKRGKRKRRTVCYKGSYVERATGITKRKRERVPCQA